MNLSLDQIAKAIGAIPIYQFMEGLDFSDTYCYVRDESLKQGKSEDEADIAACEAESEEAEEFFRKYERALIRAGERLFASHNLTLVQKEDNFEVIPVTSWADSLQQIIETINGEGYFHYSSVEDFLNSGPYSSEEEGVKTHLHWIAEYPDVYGDISAKREIEWALSRY